MLFSEHKNFTYFQLLKYSNSQNGELQMNNKEKDTIQLNKTKLRALLPAIKKLSGFLTKTAPGKCKINADADFDEEFMKGR